MRLIDADSLLDNAIKYKIGRTSFEELIKCVKDQPTAFDIEAVERELKKHSLKMSFKRKDHIWDFTWLRAISLKMAIEIVRKGGVICRNRELQDRRKTEYF